LRGFRLYRIVRAALVIVQVALRYWWLQRRDRWKRWKPTPEAWERAHAKTGRSIYRLATGLGGAFVKLGQVHAARADVMPAAFVAPLRGLHDRVPARPLAKLENHIARELGKPIDEVFASIEPVAIAAASLAQVHRARLVTGEDVVVKIQYPEARKLFPIDMGSLRRAVRVARWLNRKLDVRTLVDELAEFVQLELDFEREARSTRRVRENLAGDPTILVPEVFHASGKLLVLGFLPGTPLSKSEQLRERGVDLRAVARRVAELYARMIFTHGFFHGDPHPGNILVLDDGRLALLDFGLAKELPAGFGPSAARMIACAMTNDVAGALAAAREIGFVIPDDRGPAILALVRALLGDYGTVGELAQGIGAAGGLVVPSHFALIVRALVILSGVSHKLVPGERIIGGALAAALAPHLAAAQRAS
jgi:ubiquinone biosynthesis protein